MFGFLKKDPIKKLEKEYAKLSEKAMELQRNGDIKGYSELTSEAEAILTKIDKLNGKQ